MDPLEDLDDDLRTLWSALIRLHERLRDRTRKTYNRINPFYEDLFDWKERGAFWCNAQKNITIYNSTTVVGDVEIGDNTWIGPYCSLDGTGGLKIGQYCSISLGCQLLSHDTVRWSLSGGRLAYEYDPVIIGSYCFLGTNTIVVKGVTVGDHCVVGAGAVVTSNVPAYTIVGGVPARPIGRVEISASGQVELIHEWPSPPDQETALSR